MTESKTALVIVYSEAYRDTRVQHQIRWLHESGWVVDTIGLGPHPSPSVRRHYSLAPQAHWVTTRFGRLMNYAVLPSALRFKFLVADRIPQGAVDQISEGAYSLIIFEDHDFLPLVGMARVFTSAASRAHVHLDMHEYREPRRPFLSIRRLFSESYYRWRRKFIGHPIFDSRTTVSSKIAELYADDFNFPLPVIVRSAPPLHALKPTDVNPHEIRLIFHGMASWERGFPEILEAMRDLDPRFTMTFMLTSNPHIVARLRDEAKVFGDRVRIIPPVPMEEVSAALNGYDLEIIFFQPRKRNLHYSLPNKYFEAVQGRLGVVIGRSPMMAELVEKFGNGVIVDGWRGQDLAAAINSLTSTDVAQLKAKSNVAAAELNAENEGRVFLKTISRDVSKTHEIK